MPQATARASISEALAAANMNALVFKGPRTARYFYPDAGLRFFRDLDFLARRRDHATIHALQSNGYRRDGNLGSRAGAWASCSPTTGSRHRGTLRRRKREAEGSTRLRDLPWPGVTRVEEVR